MEIQNHIKSKVIADDLAVNRQVAVWKFLNKKIVFTNGCFDILHRGHVEYLAKAAELGEILVIGMNTDASVQKIKGPGRPVNSEHARADVLAAIGFVDAVIFFDEETPYELIKKVEPNVLVKGSDYEINDIVGHDIVESYGGRIITIPLVDGYSTTSIIDKIKSV